MTPLLTNATLALLGTVGWASFIGMLLIALLLGRPSRQVVVCPHCGALLETQRAEGHRHE